MMGRGDAVLGDERPGPIRGVSQSHEMKASQVDRSPSDLNDMGTPDLLTPKGFGSGTRSYQAEIS